jgi:hypothetical protein
MHLFSGFLGCSARFGQCDQRGYALAIAQGAIGPPGHGVPIGFRFVSVVSQPTLSVFLCLAFVFDPCGFNFTSDCVCFRYRPQRFRDGLAFHQVHAADVGTLPPKADDGATDAPGRPFGGEAYVFNGYEHLASFSVRCFAM